MFLTNVDMDRIIKQPQVIVCDYDNVLQFIDLQWLAIFNVSGAINEFKNDANMDRCRLDKNFSPEKSFDFIYNLINRDEYYIDGWFMEGKPLTPSQYEAWMNCYKGNPYFYAAIPMTPFAFALRQILSQSWCQELIILTHSIEDGVKDKRKIEKLKLFFGKHHKEKVKVKFIKPTTKKSAWIKRYKPNYTMFIDDRYDIVKDVIMNTDSRYKVFLMPKTGYNQGYLTDKDFQPLVAGLGITFSQYDDIFYLKDNKVFKNLKKEEIFKKEGTK